MRLLCETYPREAYSHVGVSFGPKRSKRRQGDRRRAAMPVENWPAKLGVYFTASARLLSFKAGLRAAEIANLTWAMVVDATGAIAPVVELHDQAAKNRGGRRIPVHLDLYTALSRWRDLSPPSDFVISSERGRAMRPRSIVNWFAKPIARSASTAARPIPAEGRSSPGQPGWSTRQAVRCATCSYWRATGLSRQRSGTSTATPMFSASSYR
jgi:integrase